MYTKSLIYYHDLGTPRFKYQKEQDETICKTSYLFALNYCHSDASLADELLYATLHLIYDPNARRRIIPDSAHSVICPCTEEIIKGCRMKLRYPSPFLSVMCMPR